MTDLNSISNADKATYWQNHCIPPVLRVIF